MVLFLYRANLPSQVSCLSSAASYAGCDQTDLACQCSSSQSSVINSAALDCIVNACGAVTGYQVSNSAVAVCSCVKTAASAPASTTSGKPPTPPPAKSTPTSTGSMGSVYGGGQNYMPTTTAPVAAVTAGAQTIGAMGGVIGGVLAVVAAF